MSILRSRSRALATRVLVVPVVATAAVLAAPGASNGVTAGAPAGAPTAADAKPIPGRVALSVHAERLDELARTNGMPTAKFRHVLADDSSSWVDKDGHLFYQEPVAPAATRESQAPKASKGSGADLVAGAIPSHSSLPGSNRVIYLDFNGHTITGTAWNASKGIDPVNVTPYDTDGNPADYSAAEAAVITDVWRRVAEDYAPFNINVTTVDPGAAAINRSSSADLNYGTRVLIDPTSWYQSGCGCGGVAYVGVYDSANNGYHQPALVFTQGVGNGSKNIAEAASHEAGHNLGLSHDGTATVGYYSGHGAWAPIMGVGYSKAITQWSKGEYSGANNLQDDFAVMGTNGAAIRAADSGTSMGTATAITTGVSYNRVNASLTDVDWFRVTFGAAGTRTFSATAAASGPILDIQLNVYNSGGVLLASWNPASGQTSASVATGMSASGSLNLAAGTYYVRVDDSGFGNPLNTGYSTYGSAGQFTLRVV